MGNIRRLTVTGARTGTEASYTAHKHQLATGELVITDAKKPYARFYYNAKELAKKDGVDMVMDTVRKAVTHISVSREGYLFTYDAEWNRIDGPLGPLPMETDGRIDASWSVLAALAEGHKLQNSYKVGDTKFLFMYDEWAVYAKIVGFDLDELSNGRGKAGVTFVIDRSPINYTMNSTDTTEGGYSQSGLRSYVESDVWDLLPSELKGKIKEVSKVSRLADGTEQTLGLKLFPLSAREIGATLENQLETEGAVYTGGLFGSLNEIKRTYATLWWLRTVGDNGFLRMGSNSRVPTVAAANTTQAVVLGFCL